MDITAEDFKKWMDEAREWAASVGYTEDDVAEVMKAVREKKRACELQ